MSNSLNLHTYSRRYCIERHAFWSKKYEPSAKKFLSSNGGEYTEKDYDTFPRYVFLDELLLAIETLDADDLPNFDTLSRQLSGLPFSIADEHRSGFISNFEYNPIEKAAVDDERYRFSKVIEKLSVTDLQEEPSLPYRRVLQSTEFDRIWKSISDAWSVATFNEWNIVGMNSNPSLISIDMFSVDRTRLFRNLKRFMSREKSDRIYQLSEYMPYNYQLDPSWADPWMYDGFWAPPNNDWVVCCASPGVVTLGGTVADAVGKHFPHIGQ